MDESVKAEKKAGPEELKELEAALKRQEEKQEGGLGSRGLKADILSVPQSTRDKNKGYKLRFINIRLPEKVQARQYSGYERVPKELGGIQIGEEYALFRIPEKIAKERTKAVVEENARRLRQPDEMEQTAAAVGKLLEKRYGLKAEQGLLINEE